LGEWHLSIGRILPPSIFWVLTIRLRRLFWWARPAPGPTVLVRPSGASAATASLLPVGAGVSAF
jgi:hypothetical protein